MPMTPKEMIRHLKKNGFEEVSQNGSHVKLKNPESVWSRQYLNRRGCDKPCAQRVNGRYHV